MNCNITHFTIIRWTRDRFIGQLVFNQENKYLYFLRKIKKKKNSSIISSQLAKKSRKENEIARIARDTKCKQAENLAKMTKMVVEETWKMKTIARVIEQEAFAPCSKTRNKQIKQRHKRQHHTCLKQQPLHNRGPVFFGQQHKLNHTLHLASSPGISWSSITCFRQHLQHQLFWLVFLRPRLLFSHLGRIIPSSLINSRLVMPAELFFSIIKLN